MADKMREEIAEIREAIRKLKGLMMELAAQQGTREVSGTDWAGDFITRLTEILPDKKKDRKP